MVKRAYILLCVYIRPFFFKQTAAAPAAVADGAVDGFKKKGKGERGKG